jgi:hypothetical protein
MKKALLIFFGLFISIGMQAQTLAEVLAKHIEAIGGQNAIKNTMTYQAETNTAVMGNDAPGKIYLAAGKGYKSVIEVMGTTATQCLTPAFGWTTNPMNGGTAEDMPEQIHASMAPMLHVDGVFADFPTNGAAVVLEGKEKIASGDAYKLIVTPKGGMPSTVYFDANTYLTALTVSQGEQEIKSTYSDYKKLPTGLNIAHKINLDLGQIQLETTLLKVETNVDISPETFKKPN